MESAKIKAIAPWFGGKRTLGINQRTGFMEGEPLGVGGGVSAGDRMAGDLIVETAASESTGV